MINGLQSIIDKKISNPRGIFLIDGIGAIISVFFLFVLSRFKEIGIPDGILHFLIFIAFIFAGYSFSCYLFQVKNWRTFLKVTALGNTFYGLTTLILIFYLYNQLSIFGISYFMVELLVLALLVQLEFKMVTQKK
ncbi:hypothetical protein [Chryseotalea sanaruensis]|uniref:hypothetical protein n=1 Tax=Chryseotalea sanaruensis TaxID=2482724 RepID=UPI000F8C7BBF|nr:hypothetical protein [Chryseotalea sanaruensis]